MRLFGNHSRHRRIAEIDVAGIAHYALFVVDRTGTTYADALDFVLAIFHQIFDEICDVLHDKEVFFARGRDNHFSCKNVALFVNDAALYGHAADVDANVFHKTPRVSLLLIFYYILI